MQRMKLIKFCTYEWQMQILYHYKNKKNAKKPKILLEFSCQNDILCLLTRINK